MVVLGISHRWPHPRLHRRMTQVLDGTTGTRLYTMPFAPLCASPPVEGPPQPPQWAHSTMWQLSFPTDHGPQAPCNTGSGGGPSADWGAQLLQLALTRCAGWAEPVPALLASTRPEDVTGYPVLDRDVPPADAFRGAPGSRVTLLGDAAHPMCPFKGQGANQALLDALSLARLLAGVLAPAPRGGAACAPPPEAVAHALEAYEREMLPRAARVVAASRENGALLHSPHALVRGNGNRATHAAAAAAQARFAAAPAGPGG